MHTARVFGLTRALGALLIVIGITLTSTTVGLFAYGQYEQVAFEREAAAISPLQPANSIPITPSAERLASVSTPAIPPRPAPSVGANARSGEPRSEQLAGRQDALAAARLATPSPPPPPHLPGPPDHGANDWS